jgi:GTP cyclohydrolase I
MRSCKVSDPEKSCYAHVYLAYQSAGKIIKITPIKQFLVESMKHELFQEDFTEYLADILNTALEPEGLAVMMTVNHFHDDTATSIATRGTFSDPATLSLVIQILQLPDPIRP